MRAALVATASFLSGFASNLAGQVVPSRVMTTADLFWSAVAGVLVCLTVLAVTHPKAWSVWGFKLDAASFLGRWGVRCSAYDALQRELEQVKKIAAGAAGARHSADRQAEAYEQSRKRGLALEQRIRDLEEAEQGRASDKLRLLRRVAVHLLKAGNALPYQGSTFEHEQAYRNRLLEHLNVWEELVMSVKPETRGADNEWERFQVLGNMTLDLISQKIERLEKIIEKLDPERMGLAALGGLK